MTKPNLCDFGGPSARRQGAITCAGSCSFVFVLGTIFLPAGVTPAESPKADARGAVAPIEQRRKRAEIPQSISLIKHDAADRLAAPSGPDATATFAAGNDCGGTVLATHLSAAIEEGEYLLQAGFVEDEIFAAQYAVNPDHFPITIRQVEFLLGQLPTALTTTTHYTVFIWDGPPDFQQGGAVVASFSSLDDPALQPVVMQPETVVQGKLVQVVIDPEDDEQIIVQNLSGTNTFSVGVRIDAHNNPPVDPCAPDQDFFFENAFPLSDFDSLAAPTTNWLFAEDCAECPSGWNRFSELPVLCRPSGDWIIQAQYESPSAFINGACCFGPDDCQWPLECSLCTLGQGTFFAEMTCEEVTCAAPTGACCISGGCLQNVTQEQCSATQGAVYAGNSTDCEADACVAGACCMADGSCDALLPTECTGVGGDFQGAGETCENAACPQPRGACCLEETCFAQQTLMACESVAGIWQGIETVCDPNPCGVLSLLSSDPPSGSIDARQSTELDGSGAYGWDVVHLTFSGNVAALAPADFEVSTTSGTAPTVVGVESASDTATLTLSGPIPTGAWSQIAHIDGGQSVCLGYLPADSNGDGTSAPADILHVIDCLNGVADPPCAQWQCDIDRSSECGPPDILRVIDLLNGASEFDIWLDAALPVSPCE